MKSFAKNGTTSTMTYDADGLRSSKTVGTRKTEYQYVGDKLFYEKRGDNQTFYYFYDSYGNLSMIRYTLVGSDNSVSTATYLVQTNSQGDVVALYTKAGNLYARYEYDAWGNTLSVTDANGNEITAWYNIANANPIRYRGYYYDSDLGLYYLQSRYYDSEIGRFINADGYVTTGQGVMSYNMYSYCQNNPVMYSDPSGKITILSAIIITVGVLAVTALDHYLAKNHPEGYFAPSGYSSTKKIGGAEYTEKVAYAEGHGASLDKNGATLFNTKIGLYDGKAVLENGTEITPFNMLNAEATAEVDISGGFSGEVGATASIASMGISPVINFGDVAQLKIEATYYFGYAGLGAEWDFLEGDFSINSPSVGVGWKIGVDFDWK